MKRKHNDITTQYVPSPHDRKVGYTWFASNSCKVKIPLKTRLKSMQTLFMRMLIKYFLRSLLKDQYSAKNAENVIQHWTPRHKLKKHTREHHLAKFVNSPERKSPLTEP